MLKVQNKQVHNSFFRVKNWLLLNTLWLYIKVAENAKLALRPLPIIKHRKGINYHGHSCNYRKMQGNIFKATSF